MGLTALVMAGGRATRMGAQVEKPLLKVADVSMLQRTIAVLKGSTSVDRIVVASSSNTPATTKEARRLGVETIVTSGTGFEEDVRFTIRKLSLDDVLVVSADLPLITVEIINEAVRRYRASRKPALAVMAEAALYEGLGAKPAYVFTEHGQNLVPVGINILDGRRIDEGTLDQVEMVINREDAVVNVNTPHDLDIANKILQGRRKISNAAKGNS